MGAERESLTEAAGTMQPSCDPPPAWFVQWKEVGPHDMLAWFQSSRRSGNAPQHGQEVVDAASYDSLAADRDELIKSLRDIICLYDSPVGSPIEVMQVMVGIARSALIAALHWTQDGGA